MKRRKWKRVYSSGVQTSYVLHVNVIGMRVEAYVDEIVGDCCWWEVYGRIGNDVWRTFKGHNAKTLADAKAKAEAELDKVVGKMIDCLTKWRGK